MEGTAQQIAAGESQKRRWVWNDNASECVAVISELTNGKASIMTRGCEDTAGLLRQAQWMVYLIRNKSIINLRRNYR